MMMSPSWWSLQHNALTMRLDHDDVPLPYAQTELCEPPLYTDVVSLPGNSQHSRQEVVEVAVNDVPRAEC